MKLDDDVWARLSGPYFDEILKTDNDVWNKLAGSFLRIVLTSLAPESDRGRLLLVSSWIDWMLEAKLNQEFRKGNSKARAQLFSLDGPFSSLSKKANIAFCAGWIDRDVYHDVSVIRKLRNSAAHKVAPTSLNDESSQKLIDSLQVPHRQYHDWGGWQVTKYEPQSGANGEDVSGSSMLLMALPIIFLVLLCNLRIPIVVGDNTAALVLELPEHMRLSDTTESATNDTVPVIQFY